MMRGCSGRVFGAVEDRAVAERDSFGDIVLLVRDRMTGVLGGFIEYEISASIAKGFDRVLAPHLSGRVPASSTVSLESKVTSRASRE
jgi:hypothetical protein